MNHRSSGLNVSQALISSCNIKSAEGLGARYGHWIERDLRLWIEYQGDTDIRRIRSQHIVAFLTYLRTDYVPQRLAGDNSRKLSPKTVYNIYISLASFFRWASREFALENPLKSIPRPRLPPDPPVEPFKKEDVELLIKACDFCGEADTEQRRKYVVQRSTRVHCVQPAQSALQCHQPALHRSSARP